MVDFEREVWAFAQKHKGAFRPKEAVQHLRELTGERFLASGGNTTKVYLAIYALVEKGKLKRTIAEHKAVRPRYQYEAIK